MKTLAQAVFEHSLTPNPPKPRKLHYKYPRLSPEDEKYFLDSLQQIWNIVAVDCLKGVAEEKGIKSTHTAYGTLYAYERVHVPRSTVICITTDHFAGGLHIGYEPKRDETQFRRVRDWMLSTPGHIVDKVAKQAFPEKYFGA